MDCAREQQEEGHHMVQACVQGGFPVQTYEYLRKRRISANPSPQCHSHPKAKDGAKRRREGSHARASGAAPALKVSKTEPHQLATPHLTPSSAANTPTPSGTMTPMATSQPQPPILMSNDTHHHNMI